MTDNVFFESRLAEIRKLAALGDGNLLNAETDYIRISMLTEIYSRTMTRIHSGKSRSGDEARADRIMCDIDKILIKYGLHAEWPGMHPLLVDKDGESVVNLYIYNK